MVLLEITYYLFICNSSRLSSIATLHFAVTYLGNSKRKPSACFRLFGIFWTYLVHFEQRFIIFGPSGPGNSGDKFDGIDIK